MHFLYRNDLFNIVGYNIITGDSCCTFVFLGVHNIFPQFEHDFSLKFFAVYEKCQEYDENVFLHLLLQFFCNFSEMVTSYF